MKTKLKLEFTIEVIESFESKTILARVYYPDEGNKIVITKGLNKLELSESIFHEVGHVIDWYLSKGLQSKEKEIRENIAHYIGENLNNTFNEVPPLPPKPPPKRIIKEDIQLPKKKN